MLAHEVALLVRPNNHQAAKLKTNKHRPVNEPKRLLPNGEGPVFHAKEKPRKPKPSLPNGERPNFGPEDLRKEASGTKGKSGSKSKRNKKPGNGNSNKNGNDAPKKSGSSNGCAIHPPNPNQAFTGREAGKKSGEESYAGSSFHSSPEALALPKPSFKSSPKQLAPTMGQQSPLQPILQQHQTSGQMGMNMHPGFVYQGMPAAPPPRYPVVAHPMPSLYQPGFDYRGGPQNYVNYPYIPSGVHPVAHAPIQQFVPPQQAPPQLNAHFAPCGERISFNDLMNSSK